MPPRECDDIEAIKACGLPRLFIVNYCIPDIRRIPLFLVLIPLTTTARTWSSTSPPKPETVKEALKPDCGGNNALKLLKGYTYHLRH